MSTASVETVSVIYLKANPRRTLLWSFISTIGCWS